MQLKLFLISAAATVLAAPALAQTEWEAQLDALPRAPVLVDDVRLGDELAAHVDDIGQRDLDRLLEELRGDVEAQLSERGMLAQPGDAAATQLDLILVEAHPNRPTFEQLGGGGDWNWDRRGGLPTTGSSLSLASFGLGSVKVEGVFSAPDGAQLGAVAYRYEESDIRQAQFAATWTDVHRGIDIFADRIADTLAE